MYCDRYCFLYAKTEVVVPRFFSFLFLFFLFLCRTVQHRISSHGTVVVQLVNHSSEEPCTHVFKSPPRTYTHARTRIHTIYTCLHMLTVQIHIRNVHLYSHTYRSKVKGKKRKKEKRQHRKKNIRKPRIFRSYNYRLAVPTLNEWKAVYYFKSFFDVNINTT